MKCDYDAGMVKLGVTRSKSFSLTIQRVSSTPGESYMVRHYQVLNLNLATVFDYNTMQVYMLRFVTF